MSFFESYMRITHEPSPLILEFCPREVRVKRCITVLVCLVVLCAAPAAFAEKFPTNSFAGQVMSDSRTGRVGIGTTAPKATLDVYQGEIKIGSSGAPCTAEIAGAMRYDNAHLQFCDGAGWRNVSLDKAQ